jgi:hypothetical protein
MLSGDYDECHYAECHYAECHYAECRSAIWAPYRESARKFLSLLLAVKLLVS